MADTPKTWTLIQKIKEALAVISVDAGYNTNAGAVVTDEPHQIPKTASVAMGVALVSAGKPAEPAVSKTHRLVSVVVVAKVATNLDDAQEKLHQLIDDVERAMDQQQSRFPDGTQFPQYVSTEVIPPKDGTGWIGAQVRYQTNVPKPRNR